MVYCSKCGTKNEDDAEYCKSCGAPLTSTKIKPKEDYCEEECAGGKHSKNAPAFWGVIVILIGLWFLFDVVIENTSLRESLPPELVSFEWWWIIGVVIVIAIISTGIRMIVKR